MKAAAAAGSSRDIYIVTRKSQFEPLLTPQKSKKNRPSYQSWAHI